MAVSTKPHRNLLEPGCKFRIGQRHAEVIETRPEGYVTAWEEWTDPKTGVVTARAYQVLDFDRVETENRYGQLVVLSRPSAEILDPSAIRRHWRTHTEKSRMLVRKSCALAAEELMAEERIGVTRQHFAQDAEVIIARAQKLHKRLVQELNTPTKRGLGRAMYGELSGQEPFVFELKVKGDDPATKGTSIYNWLRALKTKGESALFDAYRNCGGKAGHTEELCDFVTSVLDGLIDQERPSVSSLRDSVHAAIEHENAQRHVADIPLPSLANRVSPAFIRTQAARLGHAAMAIRSKGFDQAYRDMHALGIGITTLRALERVEIDEYTIDLTLLMRLTGIFKLLTQDEIRGFGLDGSAKRVVISAAIDVHTRCLLALQIVPQGISGTLKQTLEMVYTDKTSIADAMGCKYAWPQSGAPETVVLDRGAAYISDEAYHVMASLGITNIGCPAGKPWLKPYIERVFHTLHDQFLQRFSGRNFANVVERGENDPAARATLTLEEFLSWLVRWTVDGYHNHRHEGLGMTPMQAWKNATADMPVRQLTSREMRLAFGTRFNRKLGRHGLTLNRVDYQGAFLAQRWFDQGNENKEICYWHGDIGTLEVRADAGEWTTVTAKNEEWIGKTEADLREWLMKRREVDPEAEQTRLALIYEIDERSKALKAANGLFARPRTAGGIELTEAHFAQYTDTAESRHLAGPHRDLLEDMVDVDNQVAPSSRQPSPAAQASADLPDDDDLLE